MASLTFDVWGLVTDLINCIICVLIVLFCSYKYKVPLTYSIALVVSCFIPFLLNDVLFSADYMPDQFRYVESVKALRSLDFSGVDDSKSVAVASYFLSLIPIPFVETIQSLGFFNKLLFLFIFFFLYAKQYVNKAVFAFLLLYPSLLMYSSLSLRDTLIFLFMFISFYNAIHGRFFCSFIFLSPLFFIKFQNFFIQGSFLLIYLLMGIRRKGIALKNITYIFSALMVVILFSAPLVIPLINKYRFDMWQEDGGFEYELAEISGVGDFLITGLLNGFYFLLKPFPWGAQNALQLIQSVENIFVIAFVSYITFVCFRYDKRRTFFWLAFLIGSSLIYGLVVFNFGAAARYRFPFIATYVIFVVHDVFYGPMSKKQKNIYSQ